MRIQFGYSAALTVTLASFVISLAHADDHPPQGVAAGIEKPLRIAPRPGNGRNSEGDFIQLNDGRLMLVYTKFVGTGDHAAAELVARYSSDGGQTWTSDDIPVVVRKEGQANLMSVSLLRLQDSRIALFYVQKYNSPADARYPFLDFLLMRTSDDDGRTWTDAIHISPQNDPAYRVLNNDRVIQLKSGRIVVPVATHYLPGWPGWRDSAQIHCYLSDDAGKTWRSGSGTVESELLAQEPGVVELKDGRLMMFCRSRDCELVSHSTDGGETWSELKRSNIPQPTPSPASIERIPSTGDLLLVWNNGDDPLAAIEPVGRRPFTAAVSSDDGVTWKHIQNIGTDPEGWYCYTAIEFVGDHVLLAHCEFPRLNSLQITRVPIEWLYNSPKLADRTDPLPSESGSGGVIAVGVAETDITPPNGFPMAGYYHERLAEGTIDPLKARAIVFRDGETTAALVVCDLIGIATDLSHEVRRQVFQKTGIPEKHIVIAATHSHTAPDYMKELFLYLGKVNQEELRSQYIEKLIAGPVDAIVQAYTNAMPSALATGTATQTIPVAFNRRFVMRDGSVQTWQSLSNPDVVRAAGPIDPEIGLLAISNPQDGTTRGILSSFALHLDTVGGMRWSADYPFFIERTLRKAFGPDVISIFGTGCCGDINHSNPSATVRNKADFIGDSIGTSIAEQLPRLTPLKNTQLTVQSQVVQLPLEDATREEVERSVQIVELANHGGKVDFFDHVTAYKKLILDQFLHREPYAKTADHITWGLSRSLAGIGETLPVDVTVMTIGRDVAIVCLPGEVFVELGLAIKQASPFPTTIVIELSNAVETIYVPHRAAYAGGSYEVTNSAVQPGSGEMLVEAAVKLLRQAAGSSRR